MVQTLFYQFGFSCLHGKVALSKGYLLFSRVAILGYKITGISCQHIILDIASGAIAQFYCSSYWPEIILGINSLRPARVDSTPYGRLEIFPLGIPKLGHKVSGKPDFYFFLAVFAFNVRSYRIKRGFVLDDTLFVHIVSVFLANLIKYRHLPSKL